MKSPSNKRAGHPTTRPHARPTTSPGLGDELVRGLTGLRDTLRDGTDLRQRFTAHTVTRTLDPRPFSSREIKALRARLGVSQAVFARLIGVSAKTLQSWEQGNPPPAIARRLFEVILGNPGPWERMLQGASPLHRKSA